MGQTTKKAKKPTSKSSDWQYFSEVKRILESSKEDLPRLKDINAIDPALVTTDDSHYSYYYVYYFWELLKRSPEDQKRTKHPKVIKEVNECVDDYFNGVVHIAKTVVPAFMGKPMTPMTT